MTGAMYPSDGTVYPCRSMGLWRYGATAINAVMSGLQSNFLFDAPDAKQGAGENLMWPYLYRWNRMNRKGKLCRVLVRGAMNSCLVEFVDGYKAITSRNAIRKATSVVSTECQNAMRVDLETGTE